MMFTKFYTEFSTLFNKREEAYMFWIMVAIVWLLSSGIALSKT